MKLNIALMISRPLRELVMEVVPELNNYCNVTVLVAQGSENAYTLYMENWKKNDVFVFAGKILMLPVMKRVPEEAKRPYFGFDDMTGDIQDIILKLVLQKRDFDFSRTFIDIASKDNNYLGLRELLPPDQWPFFLDETIPDSSIAITESDVERLIASILQKHIQLHRSGAIDLSITRVGVIVDELSARGLPYIYILPTREYIVNFFLQVINSMDLKSTQEQLISAISIGFPQVDGRGRDEAMAQTGKSAMEYAAANGLDFTLAHEKDTLVIVTHHKDVSKMTADFSDVGFKRQLVPSGVRVHVGIGSGQSIFQAKRNSVSALEISRNYSEKIYHVTEDNKVMGPLGRDKAPFTRMPDEDILRLAEHLKIDHVYLQKIIAFTKLGNTNNVTADELADFLEVTVRTASRVLTRILMAGGAHVYEENPSGGRGRPKKYYELTFLDS
jgi:hypothetical protein